MTTPIRRFDLKLALGISFWNESCISLLHCISRTGGLLVVPSAPSLCTAATDDFLWRAHVEADYAVMDSGYLDLLLMLRGHPRPRRISGHQVIEHFLFEGKDEILPVREQRVVWVVPSEADRVRLENYLIRRNFNPALQRYYLAPIYTDEDSYRDRVLADLVGVFDPSWVVMCIGGGKQEKLGYELRGMLQKPVPILGTGAAIAFFTGAQGHIPRWADRMYLGWFLRAWHNPKHFIPRYLLALKLVFIMERLEQQAGTVSKNL